MVWGHYRTKMTTDTDSSDGWTEVERKRKNTERRRRNRRIEKGEGDKVCCKGSLHGWSGTCQNEGCNEPSRQWEDSFEDAKTEVFHNFLREYLGYNDAEIDDLSLVETKFATKGDDVLNVAMSNQEHIRELHIRRAESQNDKIIVRNFIPPNFYKRYMSINRICTDRRAEDPRLKTQLRFGKSDVELYTKYRGEEAGYRLAKLGDFMDTMELPQFDHDLKWRRVVEKPPRRKINYGNSTIRRSNSSPNQRCSNSTDETPAVRNTGLVRANSNSITNNDLKKLKPNTPTSSSSSSGEDDDREDDMEDMDDERDPLEEEFSTPTGSNE